MMDTKPAFERFTFLENFGHSLHAPSYLYQPESTKDIEQMFRFARQQGLTVALRGAGCSYNDAALNGGGIVLNLQKMNRILAWDPASGLVRLEPGVTLQQLWQTILSDGWWPPVVSGTMLTTIGGCLGMNIHGKNNFRIGTIGESVLEFTALLPTGAEITCSPKKNGDMFLAMIGGLGMLGVFTSITMQMEKVYSGLLNVSAWNVPNLKTHLADILEGAQQNDYMVGWLDCTACGRGLGRGQLHAANDLHVDDDPQASWSLQVANQTLPDKFFGIVPKSLLHNLMAPFMCNLGVWGVNTAKYILGRDNTFRQPHAAFHFLMDYIPDWELAYGRGGLIEYQSFLPKETALDAWTEMLHLSQQSGLPSYLGVTKRHRPDKFLLSYAVDGFSLALHFKVTNRKREKLSQMLQDFDRIVLNASGRFYFAKNSETTSETARRFLGEATVAKFRALKKRCDPDDLLESDLYRRIFD